MYFECRSDAGFKVIELRGYDVVVVMSPAEYQDIKLLQRVSSEYLGAQIRKRIQVKCSRDHGKPRWHVEELNSNIENIDGSSHLAEHVAYVKTASIRHIKLGQRQIFSMQAGIV